MDCEIRIQHFKRRAAELRELARKAASAAIKAEFLKMAEQYDAMMELAHLADRQSRGRA